MAYNGLFPMNYQPANYLYNQQYQMASQPSLAVQSANNNGIIWVQGEAGAKSYLVAPNNTVQLWDSESQTIYLKSADASGMPSIKILDYKIREATDQKAPALTNSYVTRDELNAFEDEIRKQIAEVKNEPAV